MFFSKLFKRANSAQFEIVASIPDGHRIYAIGDIHGRDDLLEQLLDQIASDDMSRPHVHTTLVFLGDLVDRGADTRGVVSRLMALEKSAISTVFLKGNHEELLLRVCEGDEKVAAAFSRVGGRETLLSYGVSEQDYDRCEIKDIPALAAEYVPQAHRDFLNSFIPRWRAGDYLFVHAGITPGVAIEDQNDTDMRWIREQFTQSEADHGVMVVHGHTVTDDIDEQFNRIGIDTGAYASGKLSAIGLEGDQRWYLST